MNGRRPAGAGRHDPAAKRADDVTVPQGSDDFVTRLLLGEPVHGRYLLSAGAVQDVVRKLRDVVSELDGFAETGDTAAYALVIHALARDLVSATGARGSVYRHPAHQEFVRGVNARWTR